MNTYDYVAYVLYIIQPRMLEMDSNSPTLTILIAAINTDYHDLFSSPINAASSLCSIQTPDVIGVAQFLGHTQWLESDEAVVAAVK